MFLQNVPIARITNIAREKWGLQTLKRKHTGGTGLCTSTMYRVLTNPFYCGFLRHNGELHPGKHPPMISVEDFECAQKLLGKETRPKPQKRQFAFTGLIRCGECGCMITAEDKLNRQGHRYVYYHCTKRKVPCSQKCVRREELERQIVSFLRSVTIPERFARWAMQYLARRNQEDSQVESAIKDSLEKTQGDYKKQLDNLLSLRLRELLTDDEYTEKRNTLVMQTEQLRQKLAGMERNNEEWLEPGHDLVLFASQAEKLFVNGNLEKKRMILEIVGSNPTLKDRILRVQARKPFRILGDGLHFLGWSGLVQDVRTYFMDNPNDFYIPRLSLEAVKVA